MMMAQSRRGVVGGVGNHPTDRNFHREAREEKLKDLNIRVENLQENLRGAIAFLQ